MKQALKLLEKSFEKNLKQKDYDKLFKSLTEDRDLRIEARERLISWLNENQRDAKSRLLLAKVYYIDEYAEFCVRELVELKKYTELESVDRLLDAFGDYAQAFINTAAPVAKESSSSDEGSESQEEEEDEVFAEFDMDTEFVEALEELDEDEE